MTQRQNLHYNVYSQHKLKYEHEYVTKSTQTISELPVEEGTKGGETFQTLTEKHSIKIVECQLKIKYLIIEA